MRVYYPSLGTLVFANFILNGIFPTTFNQFSNRTHLEFPRRSHYHKLCRLEHYFSLCWTPYPRLMHYLKITLTIFSVINSKHSVVLMSDLTLFYRPVGLWKSSITISCLFHDTSIFYFTFQSMVLLASRYMIFAYFLPKHSDNNLSVYYYFRWGRPPPF